MRRYWKWIWVILGAGLGAAVVWRLAARRRSLPCPAWLGWLLENPLMEASARSILARLDLRPGMRVLDVGSGPGRLTIPAAEMVGPSGEVVALDMQPAMLRRAQHRANTAGLENIRFVLGNAGGGHLELGYFDRALLVTVLGEIVDRQAALGEILLALKPGGILSVSEFFPDPHFQSQETVRRLTAQAGFEELRCDGKPLAYTMHLRRPEIVGGGK